MRVFRWEVCALLVLCLARVCARASLKHAAHACRGLLLRAPACFASRRGDGCFVGAYGWIDVCLPEGQ